MAVNDAISMVDILIVEKFGANPTKVGGDLLWKRDARPNACVNGTGPQRSVMIWNVRQFRQQEAMR